MPIGDDFKLCNKMRVGRAEKNLTQEDLANLVGIARQSVALIEAGKHIPSLALAMKIAIALEMPLEKLFYFEGVR